MNDSVARERYQTGNVYTHAPGKLVSEADHVLFCLITQMTHPIHLDEEFAAKATKHKRILVASSYVLSILMGLSENITPTAHEAMEIVSIYHPLPVFHGDVIHGESTVLEYEPAIGEDASGTLLLETRATNQNGEMVFAFERRFLLKRSSAD
jgi:acyl dehydratase